MSSTGPLTIQSPRGRSRWSLLRGAHDITRHARHCSGHGLDAHAAHAVLFWHRGALAIAYGCRRLGRAALARDRNVHARYVAGRGGSALGRDARGRAAMGRRVAHRRTSGAGPAAPHQAKTRGPRSYRRSTRARAPPLPGSAHDAARAADHRARLRREVLRIERARDPPSTRVRLLTQGGVATHRRAAGPAGEVRSKAACVVRSALEAALQGLTTHRGSRSRHAAGLRRSHRHPRRARSMCPQGPGAGGRRP